MINLLCLRFGHFTVDKPLMGIKQCVACNALIEKD